MPKDEIPAYLKKYIQVLRDEEKYDTPTAVEAITNIQTVHRQSGN